MSQAERLARVRIRSRGQGACKAGQRTKRGGVAREWADGQTAQALVAPWGLGLEPAGEQKNHLGHAEHGCDRCSRLLDQVNKLPAAFHPWQIKPIKQQIQNHRLLSQSTNSMTGSCRQPARPSQLTEQFHKQEEVGRRGIPRSGERTGAQCVYSGFLAPPAIKISTEETGDIITCAEKN